MGVENIITFDAHDARVQNATPMHGFETIQPSYQFIKALLNHEDGLHIDNDHFMIISPDEGSMNRAIYLANILGVDMGMYYKRLDYSKRVNGRHPIAAYEFLGPNLKGKDMILIDDMISSGDTVLKISSLLKERGAGRIYICSTFGLFTDGLEKFDKAHKDGVFDKLLTTNLIYQSPELLAKDYYITCDMSKYIALIIDTLNHDQSISQLRYQGYVRALAAHDLPLDPALVIEAGSFDIRQSYLAMQQHLLTGAQFTALFAISDNMAIGAMRALREAGRRIPEDCSVIAIDGLTISDYINPALTTLCQPMEHMGRRSVEILLDMVEHRGGPIRETAHTTLRTGESVRDIS